MTAYVRNPGRRGGLALHAATPAGYIWPDAAGAGTLGTVATRLQKVRWTLVFTAFFVFAGSVVSSRLQVGPPVIIAGVIGLLLQRPPLRWGTVTPLLAGWTTWCALGLVSSAYPVGDALVQLLKLCVITLVGANALRSRAQIRAYSVFVLFAFLIYPGRGSLLNYLTGAFVVAGSRAVWNGVYSNPNDLAAITILLLSVAVGLVVTERKQLYRLAALGVAAFLAFIVFITQSRGALIGLGVFLLPLLWRVPKKQRARAFFATAAVGAVVVAFAPSSVWDRLSGLRYATSSADLGQVDAEGSATQRFEIWKVARTIIAEHPVTGVGVGAYPEEHARVGIRPEFKPTARGKRDTHSTYFNVTAETGIPGLVLFATIVAVTVRAVDRTRRRFRLAQPGPTQQLLILELGLLAYAVAGIWGSYAKLNMLYLHLILLWTSAKAMEAEASAPALPAVAVPRRA